MALAKYEPRDVLAQFQRDVNRLLSSYPARLDAEDGSEVATSQWTPAVDIREDGDRFILHADLPGVEPHDIEVTMDRGVLTIKGTRAQAPADDERSYARVERRHGTFHRRFTLPDSADPERIEASGNNGVLTVTIPKRDIVQPKRIQVS